MSVFEYPKFQHARVFRPREFKNYRTYKPYLQREFGRACVYCQQPDSSAPNLNFGVDHYRPKGNRRCCGSKLVLMAFTRNANGLGRQNG